MRGQGKAGFWSNLINGITGDGDPGRDFGEERATTDDFGAIADYGSRDYGRVRPQEDPVADLAESCDVHMSADETEGTDADVMADGCIDVNGRIGVDHRVPGKDRPGADDVTFS